MKSPINFFWYSLIFIVMINTSCRNDDSLYPAPITPGSSTNKVAGRVVDENGTGIAGATVTSNGKTAITGNFGQFILTDVAATNNRLVVKCDEDGYFTASATEIPASSGTTYINLTLQEYGATTPVDASTGGTATAGASSVDIPANAVVDENGNAYNGTVTVAVAHLDPTTEEFGQLIQGADMQAIETDGDNVTLYSYGILRVELADASGNELQLSNGQNATITVPIPASMLASAPATIPLWHFDETEGIWKEEGEAVKTGSDYIGTVQHFTDWNCDYPTVDQAVVSGTVLDCENTPIANILVKTGQTYAYTDVNGKFSRRVPSGVDFTCKVDATYNSGLASGTYNVSALAAGQNYNLGNMTLTTCPIYLTGTLTDCNNNPVAGWVKSNIGFDFNYIYTNDGHFKIRVLTNQNVTITAYTDNGAFAFASMTTSSDPTQINDIGSIMICVSTPVIVGENSFTIDGDGYTNQNVIVQVSNYTYLPGSGHDPEYAVSIYQDYGTASTTDDHITGKALGLNNLNTPQEPYANISLDIRAAGTGTYSLVNNGVDSNFVYVTVQDSSTAYYAGYYKNYNAISGSLTITRFDDVNGLVEGTFSGTFRNYYSMADVTITNGKFSLVRIANNVQPKIATNNQTKKKK